MPRDVIQRGARVTSRAKNGIEVGAGEILRCAQDDRNVVQNYVGLMQDIEVVKGYEFWIYAKEYYDNDYLFIGK